MKNIHFFLIGVLLLSVQGRLDFDQIFSLSHHPPPLQGFKVEKVEKVNLPSKNGGDKRIDANFFMFIFCFVFMKLF